MLRYFSVVFISVFFRDLFSVFLKFPPCRRVCTSVVIISVYFRVSFPGITFNTIFFSSLFSVFSEGDFRLFVPGKQPLTRRPV